MSQVRNKRRNNVLAGLFVIAVLILGIAVIGILTSTWTWMFHSVSTYQVSFPIKMGVGTLSSGSQVRLGGVLIGNVVSVKPRVDDNAPTSWIDVQFEITEKYELYDNASIHARAGLLGATAWLSITNVGSGTTATNTTPLKGTTETMVAQLFGTAAEVNLTKSLDALRRISEALSTEGGTLNLLFGSKEAQALRDAIESARGGLVAIESMMTSTQEVFPQWQDSVTTILADTSALPGQFSGTMTEIQKAVEDVRDTVRDVRTNIIPNVERSMYLLKESMVALESISKKYQRTEPGWATMITAILTNIDSMSTRAKKAIDEISASPWRLLYRPTDREFAYEQLNAAAWQLVTALSELKQSAEALHAASLSPDAPAEAAALAESLAESQVAFEQARDAILMRMKIDFPNRQLP